MEHTLKFPVGTFYIHDYYLIVVINEGETVKAESNKILENIAQDYYPNQKFVYITHRINSYGVDTAVYSETSKIENLAGFAVVSKKEIALFNAVIEKQFLNKPFEIFKDLDKAIQWAKSIVNSK